MIDVILSGGFVLDGTGNPWFRTDVGIGHGRIVKLGDLKSEKAALRINSKGLVVAPGFIDMHSHSDDALLINPKAESKIRQGVTTEVIGNCGDSGGPINERIREEIKRTGALIVKAGVKLDYSNFAEYAAKLRRGGISVNVAPLIGHGNLRKMTVGYDNRPATQRELERMKSVLDKSMREGAFGLSTGLIYPPGSYAKTSEIVELAKVVASHGGIYTSHIRGEGDTLFDAVKEAILIGERSGVPVEISHHKAGGKRNWGKVKQARKLMEDARDRGVEVTCDVYPYVASSYGLVNMLPDWAHEGGPEKILERLHSPQFRAKVRGQMERGSLSSAHWNRTMIAYCPRHKEYQGKFISDLAKKRKKNPFNFAFDLLIEESLAVSVVRFGLTEEDVEYVLSYRNSMIGSDGSALAPYGILGKGHPHPRNYGTFPRVLGHYVRERGTISLPEAVRKMTLLPAQKLGLRDRGVVRPGAWADLVVFDPKIVIDAATYGDPKQYPKGIEYVIVNGVLTVSRGRHTGAKAGRVLKHS
jgi:N-acyl-D-amino-acid deacylase